MQPAPNQVGDEDENNLTANVTVQPSPVPEQPSGFDANGLDTYMPQSAEEVAPSSGAVAVPEPPLPAPSFAVQPGIVPSAPPLQPSPRTASSPPQIEPGAANVTLTAFEQDMYNSHNAIRQQSGLGGLQLDATLEYVARQRAQDMAANGYFSHYPPYLQQKRAVVFTMLENLGYRSNISGENIARNNYADSQSVATAMNAFLGSAGHRNNILDQRYRYIGVGVAYGTNGMKYYAVVFAG